MDKKKIAVCIVVCWAAAATALSVFYARKYFGYKNAIPDRVTQRERELELQLAALSAELADTRLHADELERSLSSISDGVRVLGEINEESAKSVKLLSASNTVLGAVFAELARRTEEVTKRIDQLSRPDSAGSENAGADTD